jgi:hypothetical protein
LAAAIQTAVPVYLRALKANTACLNASAVCTQVEEYAQEFLDPEGDHEFDNVTQRLEALPWEMLEHIVTLVFADFDNHGHHIDMYVSVPTGENDPIVLWALRDLVDQGVVGEPTMAALLRAGI